MLDNLLAVTTLARRAVRRLFPLMGCCARPELRCTCAFPKGPVTS